MVATGQRLTWDDYLARAPESALAEWVDGEILEHVPPVFRHQVVAAFLFTLLHRFTQLFGLGQVLHAPFAMRLLPEGPAREPDVLFVVRANSERFRRTHLEGPADIVVEVVSEDSVVRDRVEKFDEYQRAGVLKYRVIDVRPGYERADFWVLEGLGGHEGAMGGDGPPATGADRPAPTARVPRYRAVPPDPDGVYRSTVVRGFSLRVEWMLTETPPDAEWAFAELAGLPPAVTEALRTLRQRGPRGSGASPK